jgi:hypothetical protein
MKRTIESLSPEIKRALWPTLLRMITRKHATKVDILTEKSPQAEGEITINILDEENTPTEN